MSKFRNIIFFACIALLAFKPSSFKVTQLQFSRVRTAYFENEKQINTLLEINSLHKDKLRVLIRAFKSEMQLQVWAKNSDEGSV